MRRTLIAYSLLAAICSSASAAQIYKWTDAQGNIHFGERPPQGVEAALVNPNIHQASPSPVREAATSQTNDPVQEQLDAQARKDQAKRQQELKIYCDGTRANLAQMRSNPRIKLHEDGQVRRLSEEERQQRIAEAEASIKEHCR